MTAAPDDTFSFPYTVPTLAAFVVMFAVTAGVLISACDSLGKADSSGISQTETLVPLTSGAEWTYEYGWQDQTSRLDSAKLVMKEKQATFERDLIRPAPVDIAIEKQEDGGIIVGRVDSSGGILKGEDMLLRPVEAGETYQYTDSGGNNTFSVTVQSDTIDVPASTFECLRYSIDNVDRPTSSRVWIEPGVGVVQFFLGEGDETAYRLSSTNVNIGRNR